MEEIHAERESLMERGEGGRREERREQEEPREELGRGHWPAQAAITKDCR